MWWFRMATCAGLLVLAVLVTRGALSDGERGRTVLPYLLGGFGAAAVMIYPWRTRW